MAYSSIIYLVLYVLVLVYLLMLGSYSVFKPSDNGGGELEVKRNRLISYAVGGYMFIFALSVFIYLPAILYYGYEATSGRGFVISAMASIMLDIPVTFIVIQTLLQRPIVMQKVFLLTVLPELLIFGSYLMMPSVVLVYGMLALSLVSHLALLGYFAYYYNRYVKLLKMEYSDISSYDIKWAWYVCCGFTVQGILFVAHEIWYSLTVEYLYSVFSLVNCTFLTFYSRKVHPMDIPDKVVEELDVVLSESSDHAVGDSNAQKENNDGESVSGGSVGSYGDVAEKLFKWCENTQLYLNPALTRDMLCKQIGVNRNVLAKYFQEANSSYYQYVNTLRIRHACHLIDENRNNILLQDVARQCGYQNIATFRNAFREVTGKLPSEY